MLTTALDVFSARPYLLRAMHEWCTANGYTPYVAVVVDDTVQVPLAYVKNGEIVLNLSYDATAGMKLGNEFIEFKARFGGEPREIVVPVHRVIAIYAKENGQGMSFPLSVSKVALDMPSAPVAVRPVLSAVDTLNVGQDEPPTSTTPSLRPTLTRIK